MRKRFWIWAVMVLGVGVWAGAAFRDASAIPAFARRYGFSCTACHAPFPRLKEFGEDFAAQGFRMADPAQEPRRAVLDTGDPLLSLERDFPLAMRLEGWTSYKPDEPAESDFESPWVVKLLSGGPIGGRISYYFYFIVEKNEVVGFEDTYLQYNRLFGMPVDLLVGQFQVSDPLFKRELRLTRSDYEIFKVRPGRSVINLTYDRGLVLATQAPGEVDVVAQVTNGNGIEPPADGGNFDQDEKKNFSLRIARSFGPVRLGAFGLHGREVDPASGVENTAFYLGPDLSVGFRDRAALSVEFLYREDDDPFFTGGPDACATTRGGFAELHYFPEGPDGRYVLTALVNKVESDDPAADREDFALAVNYLAMRNVRVVIEAARDAVADRNRLSLGFVAAY